MIGVSLKLALTGDLAKYQHAVEVANTTAIRSATNRMKNQGRAQMSRAGLGQRLPKAFRGEVHASTGQDITRRGLDASPHGRVFSKATVGHNVDLIDVFNQGVTIQGKPLLAMPTKEAGGRKAKPARDYPPNTFRAVFKKRGRGRRGSTDVVGVLIHKVRKEVWYLLFKSVRLKKRLRLEPLHQRIAASVPADVDKRFAREEKRLGLS